MSELWILASDIATIKKPMIPDDQQPEPSESGLLTKCCQELGVSEPVAVEILSWTEENFAVPITHADPGRHIVSLEIVFRMLYLAHKKGNLKLTLLLLGYALKLGDVVHCHSAADAGKQCDCTKQNATKKLRTIQAALGLEPLSEQREESARQKMSAKRKANLTKNKP